VGTGASGQDINAVFHSPDGVAWTQGTEVARNPRAFFPAVVCGAKVWVLAKGWGAMRRVVPRAIERSRAPTAFGRARPRRRARACWEETRPEGS